MVQFCKELQIRGSYRLWFVVLARPKSHSDQDMSDLSL